MTENSNQYNHEFGHNIMPLLLSIGLHGVLFFALLFYKAPSKPIESGIETMLVSSGELAQVQAQIQANAMLAQSQGDDGDSEAQALSTSNMSQFEDDVVVLDAEYQRQMAEHIKMLENQANLAMKDYEGLVQKAYEEEANLLGQMRQQADNSAAIEEENKKQLDKARQIRDARIAEEQEKIARLSGRAIGANDSSMGDNQSRDYAGNQSANNYKASGGGVATIAAALVAHVEPHWRVPNDKQGKQVVAKIKVDSNGNVLSVNILGDDAILNQSLETAIYNASPLTPVIGTPHRQLSAKFIAD